VVAPEDGGPLVLRKNLTGHASDLLGKQIQVLIHPTRREKSMPVFQANSWLGDLGFPLALALVCFVFGVKMLLFVRKIDADSGKNAGSPPS
jgi:hypothetical protein